MPVTPEQAQELARMACAARPTGAPRWDPAGVYAFIGKVRHLALTDVMRAVANAADDRTLVTPGAIGNPTTSCWRTGTHATTAVAGPDTWDDPTDRCAECSKPKHVCESIRTSGHAFRSQLDHERALAEKRLNIPATVRGCKTIAAEQETP